MKIYLFEKINKKNIQCNLCWTHNFKYKEGAG